MPGAPMKKDLYVMAIHLVAGILIGYISFLLAAPLYSLVLAIVVAYPLRKLSVRLSQKKELGWWIGNGFVPYFFTWLVVWIIMFNL